MSAARPPLARWGVTGSLVPLMGGHRNTVLHLPQPKADLVFKSSRRSVAALAWLSLVFCQLKVAGLTAPNLIPSQAGPLIEHGWTCEPYIIGTPVSDATAASVRLPYITTRQRPGFTTTAQLCHDDQSGAIDLTTMPPDLVTACRAAWRCLADLPVSVVHGDINASNLKRLSNGRLCLLDWDEARIDAQIFDAPLADLPPAHQRARIAREIAACWQIEPQRARQLAINFTS